MNFLKLVTLSLILTISSTSAYAVQLPVAHVRLWGGDLANDQWFLDLDNKASNGVTPAVASWSCSDSGAGTAATITTRKVRIEFRDSTSGAVSWAALENDISPVYDTSVAPSTTLCGWGSFGVFSVAVGSLKASKVVIVASSFPSNGQVSPTHHLSAYSTTSTNGTKLWTRTISDWDPLSLGSSFGAPFGWNLLDSLSGVGDFLKGDGVDEIRLVYLKQNIDGSSDWNYVYLDAGTGIQIPNATKSYHVAAP